MQFEDFDLEYEVLDGLEAMNFYEANQGLYEKEMGFYDIGARVYEIDGWVYEMAPSEGRMLLLRHRRR